MNLGKKHWLAAGAMAFLLHALLLLSLQAPPTPSASHSDEGWVLDLSFKPKDPNSLREQDQAPMPEPKDEPEPQTKPEPQTEAEPIIDQQASELAIPSPSPSVQPRPSPEARASLASEPVVPSTIHALPQTATAQPEPGRAQSRAGQQPGQAADTGTSTNKDLGSPAADDPYLAALSAHLARFQQYPRASTRAREQGTVVVRFTAYADGSVSNLSVSQSSGHARLDQAALDTITRAQPLPRITSGPGQFEISLPVQFELRR